MVYHLGGKRHRLNFHDLDSARTEAQAKAAQLARGDVDAVQLTGKDRLAYGRALDLIKEFRIPLDAAAIEYTEARKILDGHSLTDAARFFIRHHGQGLEGKLVADAVGTFKAEKRAERRSELYLEDLRYRLGNFAKAFNVEVRQLTPADVRDFLGELKFSARSYNNHRRALQTFFRFCQAHGWLSKETDLLEGIGKRKAPVDIEVFTAAELRKILHAATPKAQLVSRYKRSRAYAPRNYSGSRGRTWNGARASLKLQRAKPRRHSGGSFPSRRISRNGWLMHRELAKGSGRIRNRFSLRLCAMRRPRRKSNGRPTDCGTRLSPTGWQRLRMWRQWRSKQAIRRR